MKNISLLVMLIMMLSGCFYVSGDPEITPILKTELPDLQLFENNGCLNGCWRGLRPGTTTRDEFERFFMHLNFASIHTGKSNDYTWYTRGSSNRKDEYHVEAYTKNDVLQKIWLEGPFNLTLGTIIEKLGLPAKITIWTIRGGDVNDPMFYVYWLYPNYGYVFGTINHPRNSNLCTTQANLINSLVVLKNDTIENLVMSWDIPDSGVLHNIENSGGLKAWTDYGCMTIE